MKKKSFQQIFEEINRVPLEFPGIEEDSSCELTDEIDHDIIMHRDAHFGGDFELMLEYYQNPDHLGVHPDFTIERIRYLSRVEKESGNNLAPLLLTVAEMEKIARCRLAYEKFKELYEEEGKMAKLIADLVLTEEEEPLDEIEAVVAQGGKIVPDLIAIISSTESYDPLFPGYGFAPALAIVALGQIADERALVPLFEVFGREALFDEEVLLDAFAEIGESAKLFLLKRLAARPLTNDNEYAAFALSAFSLDQAVGVAVLKQLQDPSVAKQQMLCNYLLCLCDGLQDSPYREQFIALGQKSHLSEESKRQVQEIVRHWH